MSDELTITEEIKELIASREFAALRKLVEDLEPADVAQIFTECEEEDIPILFRLLPKDLAAECFVEMEPDVQKFLIEALSDKELTEVVSDLFLDDTVDLIEEMPANVVKRILDNTSPETRTLINQLLNYPKDSAGSIMTTELVELRARMTVSDAFERIRATGLDKETVYTCYVTDDSRKLIGLTTVRDMIIAGNDAAVGDIMMTSIISVDTMTDKEEVAKLLAKYDFLALPVVDNENRLVGIVTFDDAIDVIKEEDTEDIEIMAAISPSDKPYLRTGVFETWCKRIPWLLLLMVSATFTSQILLRFENALARTGGACCIYTDAHGYRRKCRRTGFGNDHTRTFARRDRHEGHIPRSLEGSASSILLRRFSCRRELREDDNDRPRECCDRTCCMYHPCRDRASCQSRRMHASHTCKACRIRPRRYGKSVYHHYRRCACASRLLQSGACLHRNVEQEPYVYRNRPRNNGVQDRDV